MSPSPRSGRAPLQGVPWATYALLAACLGLFVYAEQESRRVWETAEAGLEEAKAYFAEHPYLDPGPVLERHVSADLVTSLRQAFRDERRGAPPIPRGVQRRQQEILRGLVGQSLARLEGLPTQRWGLRATEPEPAAFFTHPFFHAGWLHLVGNAFFLLVLGFCLERTWGALLHAPVIAGAAIASAAAFTVLNPGVGSPLIGTSGIVAGLLGAFLLRFARTWAEPSYGFVLVSGWLWLLLPAWLGSEFSVAHEMEDAPLLVGALAPSCAALFGGFSFGMLAAAVIRLFELEESLVESAQNAGLTRVANPLLDRAVRASNQGRLGEAFDLLSRVLREAPDDRDAALVMWDVANDLGRSAEATAAMLRVIREEVRLGESWAAVQHWLMLMEKGMTAEAEPALLIRIATLLSNANHHDAAVSALRGALERSEGASHSVVASRVARAARDLDSETAEEAAWLALGSLDLSLEERQSLEKLLADLPGRTWPPLPGFGIPLETGPELPTPDRDPGLWEEPEIIAEPSAQWVDSDELVAEEESPPASEEAEESFVRQPLIDFETPSRPLQVALVTPVGFEEGGLRVAVEGGDELHVSFGKVNAISVVAVHGLGPKPVIVVDLVRNWMALGDEPLEVIRFRSDRFDPRRFASDGKSPLEAMRSFIKRLLRETGATTLPDREAALGLPFAAFGGLESYQRDVLLVDEGPADPFLWLGD